MTRSQQLPFARRRGVVAATTMLASLTTSTALAQTSDVTLEEVVVTGFRKSLEDSTTAKRDAVGFIDSIFAEDIGKFPDTNIAESFNRIPGITITREITGEGLNIAIRGLGTNFTRVSAQRCAGRHRIHRPH